MSRQLFINAQIYPDGQKAILGGSLLVEDGIIKRLFYQNENLEDVEIIDLKNASIIPSFFTYITIESADYYHLQKLEKDLNAKGVFDFVAVMVIDSLKDAQLLTDFMNYEFTLVSCRGLHLIFKQSNLPMDIIAWLNKSKSICSLTLPCDTKTELVAKLREHMPVFFAQNAKKMHNVEVDGYWDLFNIENKVLMADANIIVTALLNSEGYIKIDNNISADNLKFLCRFHDHRYLLAEAKVKEYLNLGLDLIDIVNITSVNYYSLYKNGQRSGSLTKGKSANFVVIDQNGEMAMKYREGKIQ